LLRAFLLFSPTYSLFTALCVLTSFYFEGKLLYLRIAKFYLNIILMKKILLSLAVIATGFAAQSQVICAGISPTPIVGNYDFTWADPAGGDWASPDFLIPGVFVKDTLMFVDTGEPGLNAQGNPIAQEACIPLINDLTGKIAVVYRNTCWFSSKVYYAEQAGALAVIVINREAGVIGMLGNTDPLN
jgi:hypothetical protein